MSLMSQGAQNRNTWTGYCGGGMVRLFQQGSLLYLKVDMWHNWPLFWTHWPLEDRNVILKMQFSILYDNTLRWMSYDLTDDKSTLVQVMARCRQATSHYLSQCWPRSMPPYGVVMFLGHNDLTGVRYTNVTTIEWISYYTNSSLGDVSMHP